MSNTQLIVNALYLTDPILSAAIDGANSWAASVSQRGARVKLYRDYEEGDHRDANTLQMKNILRLKTDDSGINNLYDNYCQIVIDKMAGRVSVSEIKLDDEAAEKKWLEPMLTKQDFQASEGMWWNGAIRDGDAFVMIDPVTLLWSSEPAYDGFSGMVAIYNQMTRKPVWACKIWAESDTQDRNDDDSTVGNVRLMHLVVYQPTRISYWQGQEGGTEVSPMPQESTLPQLNGQTEYTWPAELGGMLPFVSYANKRNNYTRYGASEIRSAVPLQDLLNRTVISMDGASTFAAFPINWSKGMALDPCGVVPGGIINLTLNNAGGTPATELTPDQIAFLQACAIGQLPAADITQYTNQIQMIVKEISQATQTPIYGITAAGTLSGDALKQLEIGLIGKVQRFQRQNKDALEELIVMTAKIERVFQPGLGTPDIRRVHITWKSPELLDANAQIATLTALFTSAPGLWADSFYQQKIGQLLGMSKSDIETEIAAAKAQKAANPTPPQAGQGGALVTPADVQAAVSRGRARGQRQVVPVTTK